ncbi:CLUMA_CG006904, isoform A [Clunio marinus]|uniref:CLUMA_CG006904, isoform A n=1 Tax=Clunio marinus TaxID=568069 RepID=A0A1J1HZH5_9DIPT|nr:CLUMA_CG006904, isoform A [Clunio marinus]
MSIKLITNIKCTSIPYLKFSFSLSSHSPFRPFNNVLSETPSSQAIKFAMASITKFYVSVLATKSDLHLACHHHTDSYENSKELVTNKIDITGMTNVWMNLLNLPVW